MKIIKTLQHKSFLFISLFLLTTILSFTSINNMTCTPEIGCIGRHKYMSYVTVLSKGGKPLISRSIMNYKVIYIFTDRLVFYSSVDAGNAALEAEAPVSLIEQESKIERVINYGDILLDCGKFKNKLCHAQDYAGIDQIESYLTVKKNCE